MHPIGKQKLPDLDIRTLVFSPGGKDFYRKFILKHEPVYIKGKLFLIHRVEWKVSDNEYTEMKVDRWNQIYLIKSQVTVLYFFQYML